MPPDANYSGEWAFTSVMEYETHLRELRDGEQQLLEALSQASEHREVLSESRHRLLEGIKSVERRSLNCADASRRLKAVS